MTKYLIWPIKYMTLSQYMTISHIIYDFMLYMIWTMIIQIMIYRYILWFMVILTMTIGHTKYDLWQIWVLTADLVFHLFLTIKITRSTLFQMINLSFKSDFFKKWNLLLKREMEKRWREREREVQLVEVIS